MLPGLRFLFVAIVLSTSALIFGLGAAALLRSAHEEFSNLPNQRTPPETVFAQPLEATRPTLALLQVNTPVTAQKDIAPPVAPNEPNPAPAAEQPSPMASPEPDRAAESAGAATPTAAAPSEEKFESSEKSADQPPETPAPAEKPGAANIAAQPLDSQAPETQTTEARAATTSPAATSEPASTEATEAAATTTVPEPMPAPAPTGESANGASDKIATLGGPAVTIEPAPRVAVAHRARPAEIVHVRRPLKRRRIVHARATAPAPVALGAFETPPAAARPTRQN